MGISRTQEIMNRIELVARKLEMSIEDAVSILEGKHHTLGVTAKPVVRENITEPGQGLTPVTETGVISAATIKEAATGANSNVGSVPQSGVMTKKPVAGALAAAVAAGVKVTD